MFGVHSSLRRLSQSSSDEEGPPPASSGAARVKRALFGPTDHEENLRFVKNELKKARSEASSRWNFDFDSGRPLSGQYDWEEVESSTASRTICNPEKHELLAPGPAEKENRVTSCDSVEAGAGETDQPRPDARSRVSVEAAGRLTSDSLDTSDSPGTPSTPPGPSAASTASTASSLPPSHLGARHKTTLSKEKKLTEIYRSRKPRSKSSSNLKIKRLGHDGGGGARSPSVKSRGTSISSISKDKDQSCKDSSGPVSVSVSVSTGPSHEDSNSD